MDKSETQAVLGQDTYAACVCGLSILCLVSILHVSLICSFCVLSQYCLCHWYVHYVSSLNKHIMKKPETQAVLGQDTEWTNQTEAVLRKDTNWTNQWYRQHWDKTQNGQTWASCFNTACVSGLFIMCFVSILPVSLVCSFCILFQYCLCLWFVHSLWDMMDKSETQAVLGQDTEWADQSQEALG
jgi:hypothetical protein